MQGVTRGTLNGQVWTWIVGQKGSTSYYLWGWQGTDVTGTPDFDHEEDFSHADYGATGIDHLSAPGFYDDGGDGQIFVVAKDESGPEDHRYVRYNATTGVYIGHTKIGAAGDAGGPYSSHPITGADVQSGESLVYTLKAVTNDKIWSFAIADILSGTDENTPDSEITLSGSASSSNGQGVSKDGDGNYYVGRTGGTIDRFRSDGTFEFLYYISTRDIVQGTYWSGTDLLVATYVNSPSAQYIHTLSI